MTIVVMLLAAAALLAYIGRDMWFHADAWAYLTKRDPDIAGILDPHANHLTVTNAGLVLVLREVVGLDFQPWWWGARVVAWMGFVGLYWWVLRRRGTDPVLALVVAGVLLVNAASAWHQIWTVGNLLVHSAAGLVALVLAAPASTRQRVLIGLLLTVAVTNSSSGIAVLAGCVVATVLTRRLRELWPALLAPVVVYGAWYALYRAEGTGPPISLDALVGFPEAGWTMLSSGIGRLAGTPGVVTSMIVVLLLAALALLGFRRQLDAGDLTLLAAAASFVGMVAIVRLSSGASDPTASRYGFNVTLFVIPVLVRHAPRLRARVPIATAVVVGLVMGWVNLRGLSESIDFWELRSQESRLVVEAAGELLHEGEPAVELAAVDAPRAGQLRVAGVRALLADGWSPAGAPLQAKEAARLDLRVRRYPFRRPLNDCVPATPVPGGRVVLRGRGDATLVWQDHHGLGRQTVSLDRGPWGLVLADVPGARLRVHGDHEFCAVPKHP